MANIAVIGAGSFGIALAVLSNKCGHNVSIWSPFENQVNMLVKSRESSKLPGIKIDSNILITTDKKVFLVADTIIIATPSVAVRETAKAIFGYVADKTIITCVAKGLEDKSYKTLHQVIAEELPNNPVVALSGPSHAEELSKGVETTVVAASEDISAAEAVQDMLMSDTFRIYVSDDIIGVELGGALKNVIALAVGALDGLGAGDNTKAALMTRGMTEISRLGIARGGRPETFSGLSGIGDLIVTCASKHSRNRRFGILIGQGKDASKALEEVGMVVEGYTCAKVAYELAKKLDISMPITEEAYMVLYQGKSIKKAIKDLMKRPKRNESERQWLSE